MPEQPYDPRVCPYCGGTDTHWRTGREFDHERRCVACQRSYDPEEEPPCAAQLWNAGKPSPRTCERCGLGPCPLGEIRKEIER